MKSAWVCNTCKKKLALVSSGLVKKALEVHRKTCPKATASIKKVIK